VNAACFTFKRPLYAKKQLHYNLYTFNELLSIKQQTNAENTMSNIIPKDVEDIFLSAGIDKQTAFEFIVHSNVENFRQICSEVNPENDPKVDKRLKEGRRQVKNRQSARNSRMRQLQLNPEVPPPQPVHYREDIELDDIALISISTTELNLRLKEKGITKSRQREIKSERRALRNRQYSSEMRRRYMEETRNVGVARQSAEENNELVDCADGMDNIGQTRFSLEQIAELEDRFGIVGVAKQSEEEKNELVDCADGMDVIGQTRFSLEQIAELEVRFIGILTRRAGK